MVLHGRHEGWRSARRAVARSCVAFAWLLAAASAGSAQPDRAKHRTASEKTEGSAALATPATIRIIQVEPSAAAIAEAAKAEAAEGGVFGLQPDAWVAICTAFMALFTAALVGVTFFLFRATRKLAKSTVDLAVGAEDQAREMGLSRLLAEKQHELEEKQFLLAGRQCDLAEKQHGVSRLQYYAENRPRLVLKDVYFDMNGLLSFEIANIGGISATITDGWAAIGHVVDERWFKLRSHGEVLKEELAGRQFDVSELKTLTAVHSGRIGLELLSPARFLGTASDVFFYGAFHYVDERGSEFAATHLAVFRRQWHPADYRFMRTSNPDHEYSD